MTENNPQEKSLEERLLEMRRMTDPAYLPTISMNELYQNVYQSRPPIIDGLLYPGTYLFAGAPKVGNPVLEAVAALVTADSPTWGGTATELAAAIQTDMKPNALRRYVPVSRKSRSMKSSCK